MRANRCRGDRQWPDRRDTVQGDRGDRGDRGDQGVRGVRAGLGGMWPFVASRTNVCYTEFCVFRRKDLTYTLNKSAHNKPDPTWSIQYVAYRQSLNVREGQTKWLKSKASKMMMNRLM